MSLRRITTAVAATTTIAAAGNLVVCQRKRLDPSLQGSHIVGKVTTLLHGMTDKRLDHRENILDAMVELFVQHALADVGAATMPVRRGTGG